MTSLHPKLAAFGPKLIIFDKDGTLIDFHAMWGGWLRRLGERLESITGRPVAHPLFERMGFDPASGRIAPQGHLAITPIPQMRALTGQVLQQAGLSAQAAEALLSDNWRTPDPVTLARPLTNLERLFKTLRGHSLKIGVATSGDRAPTEALLAAQKVAPLIDSLICANDGIPIKPAPDMILTLCRRLDVAPTRTAMIGDNPDDLKMAQAAGAGLKIGVLSGVSTQADLSPHADLLLPSIDAILQ